MEKECLIEKTSFDYSKNGFIADRNHNQTLKGPDIKTMKTLGKPLEKINFSSHVNDDNILLNASLKLPPPLKNFSSTPSKFSEIIHASFTSESSLAQTTEKAKAANILVNTDLKKSIGHSDWAVVVKKILIGTLAEAVHAALSKFGIIKLIKMQLNAMHVARANLDKKTWDVRDYYRALLYILPIGTNAYNIWDFVRSVDEKTYIINCHSVTYARVRCVVVCFDSVELLDSAMRITPVLKALIYVGLALFLSDVPSMGSQIKPFLLVVTEINDRFAALEYSLISLAKHVDILAKRLETPEPMVSQLSLGCQLLVTLSLHNQEIDIVMNEGSSVITGDETVIGIVVFDFSVIGKIENTLKNLAIMVMSLSAKIDNASLVPAASFSQ
ncbi:hypothetical protein G9A89_003017 [Geosiphon pyriformis]|nr:hypothetical protein G9A89_003017 [Geosiphon pyriformis]